MRDTSEVTGEGGSPLRRQERGRIQDTGIGFYPRQQRWKLSRDRRERVLV